MENFRRQVSPQKAPCRAISSSVDGMLFVTRSFCNGPSRRAVGENSTILDQGLVSKGAISDEDGGSRTDSEGDYGAKFVVNIPED